MAVGVDSKLQVGPFPGSSFTDQSFTVGSNSNRVLIAILETGALTTVSSLSYGGSAMTLMFSDSVTGDVQNVQHFAYYLLAPSTGANNFVISASGTQDVYCNAYSLYDAVQSAPASNKSAQGTTTETASLTAVANDYGIGVAISGFTKPTGYSLSGDASSNQLGLNQWFTGDTNGGVSAGTRTAVSNYTSGGSSVQAGLILVSEAAAATTTVVTPRLLTLRVG